MATSKTLTPTNVTIQIPDFTDQPDQRVNSNCIDKEADAINSLNTAIANYVTAGGVSKYVSTGSMDDIKTPGRYFYANQLTNRPSTTDGYLDVYALNANYIKQIAHESITYKMYVRYCNNGTWSSWDSYALTNAIQTVTPTIDTTRVQSGTVECVIKGGWAFISGSAFIFKAGGNNQNGVITGVPKAALQVNTKFGGADAGKTADIHNAGDGIWINKNQTTMNVHIGATYGYQHWFSVAYPIATS